MKEAKKMKWYKNPIHKELLQVSGLCGTPFLSYLPRCLKQLYRALYGGTILKVHQYGGRKSTRTSGIHFCDKCAFFSLVS